MKGPSSSLFVENPGVEDYRRAARDGLRLRDFRLAFEQIGAALTFDPLSRESLSILEAAANQAPDPVSFLAEGSDPYFGLVAVRAWLLEKSGDLNEALLILLSIVEYRPDVPFLAWARIWLRKSPQPKLRWDDLGPALSAFFERVRKPDADLDACATNIEAAILLLTALRETTSERAAATVIQTAFLRLLGRTDDALRAALAERERSPSFLLSVELAHLHRERGDLDAVVESFREATSLAPEREGLWLSLGEALLDRGDFEEAIPAFERVLSIRPDHPGARPRELYARGHLDPASSHVVELRHLAERGLDEGYSRRLTDEIAELRTLLPSPSDPISRIVAGAIARMRTTPQGRNLQIRVQAEHAPPPSAEIALQLASSLFGVTATLHCEIARAEGNGVGASSENGDDAKALSSPLWTLVEGRWSPLGEPPPQAVSRAISELSETPFDDDVWAQGAADLTRDWGETERAGLRTAAVHPSAPPAEWHPLRWVFVTQVAAAYCIAALPGPWEGSSRRDCLFQIARGPDDSTVSAAVIALGRIARTDPEARAEIEALFLEILDARRDRGESSTSEPALVAAWLRLPGLSVDLRRRLWGRRRKSE